jgi:hypothetical protein
MEAEMWRLSQAASQWEDTCKAAHAALDEHRMEHIKLVQELEATAAELHTLQQQAGLAIVHWGQASWPYLQAFTVSELSSSCDDCSLPPDPIFELVKKEQMDVLTEQAATASRIGK